jgi:hypothetical protein
MEYKGLKLGFKQLLVISVIWSQISKIIIDEVAIGWVYT